MKTLEKKMCHVQKDGSVLKTPSTSCGEIIQDHLNPQQCSLTYSTQEKWLTTIEAAAFLKISPKCLLNLTSNGKIPHYKFGRRNRYRESDLTRLLLANPRGGTYGN